MTIVHLIPQLRLGAGRYVVELATRQAALSGQRVVVLISVDAEPPFASDPALVNELRERGVDVRTAGDFFHRNLDGLLAAAREMRDALESGTWLAHAHTAMAAGVAWRAGATTVIATCHGVSDERPPAFDVQDALGWQLCDAVTTPSRHWACRLEQRFGLDTTNVIPVGLDLSAYPHSAPRPAAPTLRLVVVAEHILRKGLDLLIDALPAVWRNGIDATCHFMGRGPDTDDLRLRARAIDPYGHRIVFEGFVTRPYARLPEFDVFVLPSRADNQPVAGIEAMLAALPLVVTDVGGLGDMVRDARNGWVVPPENPSALAHAILEAGRMPAPERGALGRAGEAFARRTFDIRATTAAIEDVYRRALQSRRPRASAAPVRRQPAKRVASIGGES